MQTIHANTPTKRRQYSNRSQTKTKKATKVERLKEFFQRETPQWKQTPQVNKTTEEKLLKSPIKLETIGLKRASRNPLKMKKGETMSKTTTPTERLWKASK